MSAPAVAAAPAVRERPIPFDAHSVRATLLGLKSQTRRVVVPQPELRDGALYWQSPRYDNGFGVNYFHTTGELSPSIREAWARACPYGRPGDRLWVREPWRALRRFDAYPPRDIPRSMVAYEASAGDFPEGANTLPVARGGRMGRLRPGMFIPRWASRLLLELTAVRVERLHQIAPEDAVAEGLPAVTKDGTLYKHGVPDDDGLPGGVGWAWSDWRISPVDAYERRWDEINKARGYGWATNPYVWVLTFTKVAP